MEAKEFHWIKFEDQKPDLNKVHFIADGNSLYIRGSESSPFLIQIAGEVKPIGKINWTYWAYVPKPPTEIKQCLKKNTYV
jgi:hypothetical protein